MNYHEREELKGQARDLYYAENATIEDKCKALVMVAEAHFYRSLEANPKNHADLRTFVQHWIWSSDDAYFVKSQAAVTELRKHFPKPKRQMIADGSSYWGSTKWRKNRKG